jgi:DNA repair protein RecN (Recombination protein N)
VPAVLYTLNLKNFILINQLDVDFANGFNVLTGETGAGKSILIDAISLLLGGRGGPEYVRSGEEKACIDGIFTLDKAQNAMAKLRELGLGDDEDDLLISREIFANGRSVCRVNGRPVNVSTLRTIGDALVDIHGQNLNQILMISAHQRDILDDLAGEEASVLREKIRDCFRGIQTLESQINDLGGDVATRLKEQDSLTFQIEEIEKAGLQNGEEEALLQERARLSGSEKIAEALAASMTLLNEEEEGRDALTMCGKVIHYIESVSALDGALAAIGEELLVAQESMSCALRAMSRYMEEFHFSPERLDYIESRLFLIGRLKSKYGENVGEILATCQRAQDRIEQLAHAEEQIAQLEREKEIAWLRYTDLSSALTIIRQRTACAMEAKVVEELQSLEMGRAQFIIELAPDEPAEYGCDGVQFLVSANPGEEPKLLSRVASGGELARIMLAIKTILSEVDQMPTLIFDEVDAGIGGRTAHSVGERLDRLGLGRQVVCVTHSPQIAALADHHLCIEKQIIDEKVEIDVRALQGQSRTEEIARMLAGKGITAATLAQAKELIERKGAVS